MKLGLLLPTFRDSPRGALELAAQAERLGLDGVFAYDHLWPMGDPTRPALAPLPVLALVAARSRRLWVGPLVARVGQVATETLVAAITTLDELAPGRIIAALGTGDRLSRDETLAYGVADRSASERRALLEEALVALESLGVERWCGAGAGATNALARRVGVTLNFWAASASALGDEAVRGSVSWAGPLGERVGTTLDDLAAAGATWAVAAPPLNLDELARWRTAH